MKIKLTCIALFVSFICLAQEKLPVKSGVITLTNNATKQFINLEYKGDTIEYFNIETEQKETLFLKFVKAINAQAVNYTVEKTETSNAILQDAKMQFNNVIILLNNGEQIKSSSANLFANSLNYKNSQGETLALNLNEIKSFGVRKGSHFWSGIAGGFIGGTLGGIFANAISNREIISGIGPGILAGTLVGGIIGAVTPRYKAVDLNTQLSDNMKLEIDPLNLRLALKF